MTIFEVLSATDCSRAEVLYFYGKALFWEGEINYFPEEDLEREVLFYCECEDDTIVLEVL